MWFRISHLPLKQIDAGHLDNPKHPEKPMVLTLFQVESRTFAFVQKSKKAFPMYQEPPLGKPIAKRRWTPAMRALAEQELSTFPAPNGGFKFTIVGWIFVFFFLGLFGYLAYDSLVAAPQRTQVYEERQTELTQVSPGDIYLGRIEVYKEKNNPIGMEGFFGCFKVLDVQGNTYHILKSVEMSKTAKPLESLNSVDFESEPIIVEGKEIEAYHKTFASSDGLTQISFTEKK